MVDSNLSMLANRQRSETVPGMDPVILWPGVANKIAQS